MYNWDRKSQTEEKSRKNTQNPSFSSSLLDEIYRSIDGVDDKSGEFKIRKDKVAKKQTIGRVKASSAVEDEEIAGLRRDCLVEKWMQMKVNEKLLTSRRRRSSLLEFDRRSVIDNDPLFFSSGSSSSDSSFGWFSESDILNQKPSCFGPINMPKPIKTNVVSHSGSKKENHNKVNLIDDRLNDHQSNSTAFGLIRSKARASKIYENLKKLKQPISPGGRLTTFINSLFTNGHGKKSKDSNSSHFEIKSKSNHDSTCSSASSFSRSCLSKNSPSSREKLNDGTRRTVRFYSVSDSPAYCKKAVSDEKISSSYEIEHNFTKKYSSPINQKSNFQSLKMKYFERENKFHDGNTDDDDYSDDDMASDASSDLFELDHLVMFKNDQYCEELPVYETTHFGTNRAIANGLIC